MPQQRRQHGLARRRSGNREALAALGAGAFGAGWGVRHLEGSLAARTLKADHTPSKVAHRCSLLFRLPLAFVAGCSRPSCPPPALPADVVSCATAGAFLG